MESQSILIKLKLLNMFHMEHV